MHQDPGSSTMMLLRQKLLDEVTQPLDGRRSIEVVNPTFLLRKPDAKISESHYSYQTPLTRLQQTCRRSKYSHVIPYGYTKDT